MLRACPRLESLRFYVSDAGCRALSRIPDVRHLHLEMEDAAVGDGFGLLARRYAHLVSLQLTFRSMSASQLVDVADNCPRLAVLRLIGFQLGGGGGDVTARRNNAFSNLRTIDLRMVKQMDDDDEDDDEDDDGDTVSPQLMHFLLDFSLGLEELTVEAVAGFMDETFLQDVLAKNPLSRLSKLRLLVMPTARALTADMARQLLHALPELSELAVSRWNVSGRELRALIQDAKNANLDVRFV